jgi:hypothetical protein
MQGFQPPGHLDEYPPNVILLEMSVILLMIHDLLIYIAIACIFHHDA